MKASRPSSTRTTRGRSSPAGRRKRSTTAATPSRNGRIRSGPIRTSMVPNQFCGQDAERVVQICRPGGRRLADRNRTRHERADRDDRELDAHGDAQHGSPARRGQSSVREQEDERQRGRDHHGAGSFRPPGQPGCGRSVAGREPLQGRRVHREARTDEQHQPPDGTAWQGRPRPALPRPRTAPGRSRRPTGWRPARRQYRARAADRSPRLGVPAEPPCSAAGRATTSPSQAPATSRNTSPVSGPSCAGPKKSQSGQSASSTTGTRGKPDRHSATARRSTPTNMPRMTGTRTPAIMPGSRR